MGLFSIFGASNKPPRKGKDGIIPRAMRRSDFEKVITSGNRRLEKEHESFMTPNPMGKLHKKRK